MTTEPAIRVSGLGKRYTIGARQRRMTFREMLTDAVAAPFRRLRRFGEVSDRPEDTIWALKDVSFDVQRGEVVGIIGSNGAGKSTLLKVLSQITYQTEGRVELRGRVGSLLEVGTGFHRELTGRENIFLNGAILGMKRAEIAKKFDEIVEFSGIEKFIDTPVKRYSSGMYVRLAFAVAAHMEPEILLVDEVLAVGDIQFQNKCLGKMGAVSRSGRTILFVSHNMAAIDSLCTRALLLHQGKLVLEGPAGDVVRHYVTHQAEAAQGGDLNEGRIVDKMRIVNAFRVSGEPGTSSRIELGGDVRFSIELQENLDVSNLAFGIHIYSCMGQRILTLHSTHQYPDSIRSGGINSVVCTMQRCLLQPGPYTVILSVVAGADQVERFDPAARFEVVGRDLWDTGKLPRSDDGVVVGDAKWEVVRSEASGGTRET